MHFVDFNPPATEVLATLTDRKSICKIVRHKNNGDNGNSVEAVCENLRRPLGFELKGISLNRINSCRVFLTINAVRFPHLLDISNCGGKLKVLDVGSIWKSQLQHNANVREDSIEYVSYESISKGSACYNVNITFDVKAGREDTAYKQKNGRFCAHGELR